MNKEHSLEENAWHGTKEQPIWSLCFTAGKKHSYPGGFLVERHWHHSIEMLYVRKGSYLAELDLDEVMLQTGDICIVNSGVLHEIRGRERETEHDVILFDPRIFDFAYQDRFQEQLTGPLLERKNMLPQTVRPGDKIYQEFLEHYKKAVSLCAEAKERWYLEVKLELLWLINLVDRAGGMVPSASIQSASEKEKINRYKRVVSYMEEHYMERITLEELAALIPCNLQYLCQFFREIAGVPPIHYLISCRLNHACDMLANSTQTVLEVSMDCGFDNVSYFIRQFRKSTGMTPGEYRKKSRKG